jgi:hypoxanthine-DNA glycosylase
VSPDTAKRSFPAVVDAATRVLILGSLPGEASLARGQYYAHPQNQAWRLLAATTGTDLAARPYAERLATLLDLGIGLWDVIAQARRVGSLDTAIRDHQPNALPALIATLPALRAVAFNGATAAKIGRKALGEAPGVALLTLPSSSPAHTLAFDRKLEAWLAVRAFLGGG